MMTTRTALRRDFLSLSCCAACLLLFRQTTCAAFPPVKQAEVSTEASAESGRVLPVVKVTSAGTVITQSCRVLIPKGLVLSDTKDRGVIIIGASGITLDFAGDSVLRGSPAGTRPDNYKGYGIRLKNHSGVTIRGARITGFWCGIRADHASGLVIENVDASDNRRDHLGSTPMAEDSSDWLYGQDNDDQEWLKKYGAAIYIENSGGVTVRDSRVWHGQNALCLDRVTESRIYDNDFSFNSGWGIAMWRCSSNVVSRNALDFCVRGYSDGVYNRGQDSAGIVAFEQNNDNTFAENSVTHGGDGFFGFAGREALGQTGQHPINWYRRRGNDDNLLIGNDFSYAAAHGIENTFSFGNEYVSNRIVGNAICGVWAGYSRDTVIAENEIADNGGMGYGLERGGINIDHGGDNLILRNRFSTNKCGVHLWGGANPDFAKTSWAKVNGYASTGSVITENKFNGDSLAFQFRGPGQATLSLNQLVGVWQEINAEPDYQVLRDNQKPIEAPPLPAYQVFGTNHPVGARTELRGRQNIVMTEWGPWDHVSPLVRLVRSDGGTVEYQISGVPFDRVRIAVEDGHVRSALTAVADSPEESLVRLSARQPGADPYVLKVSTSGKLLAEEKGTLIRTTWRATFFDWPEAMDPRKNIGAYRELANSTNAVTADIPQLRFDYGTRGPSEMGISDKITAARLGHDHFGMVARTQIHLTQGTWKITTLSDDGVRVSVDGKPVVENWKWHGPTLDSGTMTLSRGRTVSIVVEHFEIDGYAVLEFSMSREE